MKTYIYSNTNNNNTSNNKIGTQFLGKPDYSKILNSIIASHIKETNPYLKKCGGNTTPTVVISKKINNPLKSISPYIGIIDSAFSSKSFPIKVDYGKSIEINGHTITFFEDEIQIDFDFYPIENFFNSDIFENISPTSKKTIINIYGKGDININVA